MRLLQREGGREVIVSYRLFVRGDDCKYRDLRIANLVGDAALMSEARESAARILDADPQESLTENAPMWAELRRLRQVQQN